MSDEADHQTNEEYFAKWLKSTLTTISKPLWRSRVRMAEYQASPGANGSVFLEDTPAQMKYAAMDMPGVNYAFALGDAVHIATLEPERFDKEKGEEEFFQYVPSGQGLKSKSAQDAFKADPSKPVVTPELISKARKMRDAILNHRFAKKLLSAKADTELSGWAWDNDSQLIRKVRVDFLPKKGNFIADLKSCASVNEMKFWSDVKKLKYAAKSAFYQDTTALIENTAPRPLFYLIAVEGPKAESAGVYDAPYICRVFLISHPTPEMDLLSEGRAYYQSRLGMFANAAHSNDFEGYEHEEAVQLTTFRPRAFFKQQQQDFEEQDEHADPKE